MSSLNQETEDQGLSYAGIAKFLYLHQQTLQPNKIGFMELNNSGDMENILSE